MESFLVVAGNLVPLYSILVAGYLAGTRLRVDKEPIAKLLIYIITPVVVFDGASVRPFDMQMLALPLIFFGIASLLAILVYKASLQWHADSTRNILAFAAGAGNTGYFGLPVALALFGEEALPIVIACILGTVVFENTVGFFLVARGNNSTHESLRKLFRLPSLYAFLAGVIFSLISFHPQSGVGNFFTLFRGAYSVLGMMMIGLALSSVRRIHVDLFFIFLLSVIRFIVWPILVASALILDRVSFQIFSAETGAIMLLLSAVPVAANTVSYATELHTQPEKAAVGVCVTTAMAAFMIPLLAVFIELYFSGLLW